MDLKLQLEFYPKNESDFIKESNEIITANFKKWDPPFFTDSKQYYDLERIYQITEDFKTEEIQNIIILATGGSIQTFLALKHLSKKKIFPIYSSRAVELKRCLDTTSPDNSVVIPISRGGETLDVNSTIGIFSKLGYKFIGLSSKGMMNKILKKLGSPIMDVPDLSGRFAGSVTNVGLVPANLAGINIENFLEGLEIGYKSFMEKENSKSLEFAIYLFNLYKKGYRITFSMPYSKNIEGSVGLFVQEISESTGKDGKGLMGSYQSAPLCQHSVLEFLLGGSKGVVIPILWTIEQEIPDILLESSIDFVDGKTAQTVINYQADATFQALIEQSVPSAKISLDFPNEFEIGQLISFIQSSIYYLCLLLDVNWADNPKVNIGKIICNETLKSNIPVNNRVEKRKKIARKRFKKF
jgi:glucose-6-phosphate isomerase